ncbi:MAG: ABC transporter ATP-binding protein [Epulopiscium sp.]|nr:ABC transporter ATP-binding protein [Candidatus Epulonipiscium sp.]
MDSVLQIQGLAKNYDGFHLKDVSFRVPKGSIMGFVGENGAGKTTTIKLILNLIKKDDGIIQVFGLDHIEKEQQIKEQIGVVLDESYFHENLKPVDISKVMKNIYHNWDESLFFEYMQKFKLPKDKIIKEFSKGMKMKLSIATALSHNPKLLILDEATSGLDPIVRSEILDIFLEFIQNEERSIFFSTHITSDIEKIADYITFIHEGKIIFSEPKDDLLYQYGLIRCGNHDFNKIQQADIIGYRKNQFGYEVLVKDRQKMERKYRDFIIDDTQIEDIMLFYVRGEAQ